MGAWKLKKVLTLLFCWILMLETAAVSWAEETGISWTAEEKAFIQAHPVIQLGIDPGFVPFEFVDKDGIYKGIAADYIELLSQRTGIQMVIAKDLTWSEAYEKAVERELDVLPCVSITKERQRYFAFSEPYYYFQRVIVVKDTNNDIKDIEDLYGRSAAVQANSSHHGFLKDFPEIQLNPYKTVEEGLFAVANNSETAYVGNLATSSYLIKANGLTNLKFVKIESSERQSLHFAVRNDWPELVSIINKGLASITEEEKIEINNRWIGLSAETDYGPIIRIALIIGAILLLILLVSAYWIVRLRREIAKRKQIEEALIRAKHEAEVANHIKSSFLARMSHEIRTPLNAITGMSYLMKKTEISLTQRMYLEKIVQASGNMLSIINDILDFSKIEAGKVEIETISFNLDKAIQDVINIVSFRVEEQGIAFSLSKEPKLPNYFFSDPKRLEQILLNILNNAIKFTHAGEVSLTVRSIAQEGKRCHLEFLIKDTGIGMTADQISQLFEPFAQADSSINRRFGGTGLGLSIVKSLLDMMGGEIEVYSTPGAGSTFIIKLAMDVDTEKEQEEKQRGATVYFQDIRAIVLEKTGGNLNLIGSYLGSFGMEAELTTSASRVMQMLETHEELYVKPFDLLILDYETPGVGGFEFVQQIRSNAKIVKKPKIIMILPLMREDLFDRLEGYGIEIGIAKPIIPSVLYNGILELFKAKALAANKEKSSEGDSGKLRKNVAYTALVVEDNKTNQFIAKSILEEVGFKVHLADDGEDGVTQYKKLKNELHVILMDLHMPVLNGYEATAQIRAIDTDIPIIAMTADAVTGVEEKCRELGIDHYISKPFDPDQFVNTIIDLIEVQQGGIKEAEPAALQAEPAAPQAEPASEQAGEPLDKAPTTPILDEADGLKHLGNNPELYEVVLRAYREENLETARQLSDCIAQKRYQDGAQVVHKAKSSSGSIGAKQLQAICKDLQKALESEAEAELPALEAEFVNLMGRLLEEIEARETK